MHMMQSPLRQASDPCAGTRESTYQSQLAGYGSKTAKIMGLKELEDVESIQLALEERARYLKQPLTV